MGLACAHGRSIRRTRGKPWPRLDAARRASQGSDRASVLSARYSEEVAYTDREIGRLLDALEASAPGSIVVLTADHGEGLYDHGVSGHGVQLYEEAVRIPLIVVWPGFIPRSEIAEPVALIDIVPTLLDLAGIESPRGSLQGRSLARRLTAGEPLDPNHPIFLHRRPYSPANVDGVWVSGYEFGWRRGPWKVIYAPTLKRLELYNLSADPRERRDVKSLHRTTANDLVKEMRAFYEQNRVERPPTEVSAEDREALEAMGYVQ